MEMEQWFAVDHLDVERLLVKWRWLCPGRMDLVARTAFGDLFLRDGAGAIFWLNTAVGQLTKVSGSEAEFREAAETREQRREWFAEPDVEACAKRALNPTPLQCVGFSIPVVFAESGASVPYIADLYEYVSFLGDLNRQIASVPDGAKVELRVQPPKPASR
jgi:hypothetical protein